MGLSSSNMSAQSSDQNPSQPQSEQTSEEQKNDSAPLSKKAQKRLLKQEKYQEKKEKRKAERRAMQAEKKIFKQKEREDRLKHLPQEERDKILSERIAVMRAGRVEERARKGRLREILQSESRFNVCVDLGWNAEMTDKERKSLARQLAYSYNAVRKCVESGATPVKLSICGIDDSIGSMMTVVCSGWESWPIAISETPLVQVHARERIVYLTHDADEVLEKLVPEDVYVIGGIVDRNRLKGATFNKTQQIGVRAARLNLDTNVAITHGTPVLTVNHCVEILLHAANGMSWKDAYLKVLPVRKGLTPGPAAAQEDPEPPAMEQ